MKVIYHIAKAELQLLFYSPIAWLLLLCFSIQSGFLFIGLFEKIVLNMHAYGIARHASQSIFNQTDICLWPQVLNYLYFYIPLLTMGCISRDLNNGAIKLLYSSPIGNLQIILGKYFSLVCYALILMGILAIYVIIGWCSIENFEAAWVWSGLLGLFLLTCTYMAIGLFMSSLTSYQIIAAVGTFVAFMLLSAVKGWGQQYDFIREITYWLSIDGRVFTFIQGILCSEDLIYFPVIIGMFLTLTVIRLYAIRQKQHFLLTLGKSMLVIIVVGILAFVSSRPALLKYYDTTYTKENTLTNNSQSILKEVDGGMTITAYVNILDPRYLSFRYPGYIMENQRFFRQYTRFKPEMDIRTVYYYAEPDADLRQMDPTGEKAWAKAKLICEEYKTDSTILRTQEEIDQMVDLSEEGYTFIWQIVRDNGQKQWLRVYNMGFGIYPDEAEISVAFKRMVMALPKIGFVTGHGERNIKERQPQGYYYVSGDKKCQFSVWNQGFDVKEITLSQAIPEDISVLMIADPQESFTACEEKVLSDYINEGRNLFILGEPGNRESFNPTLRKLLGVELTPLLVQKDMEFNRLSPEVLAAFPTKQGKEKMLDLRKTYSLSMPTCAGVELVEDRGFSFFSAVMSSVKSPCWTELETVDFVDDTVVFNPTVGEVCKEFTTVMGLYRQVGNREQRIIISGDADVLANNEFIVRRNISSSNESLMLGGCRWLSYGEVPIDIRRPSEIDNRVFMSVSTCAMIKYLFRIVLPLFILGMYLFLWLRRRGR